MLITKSMLTMYANGNFNGRMAIKPCTLCVLAQSSVHIKQSLSSVSSHYISSFVPQQKNVHVGTNSD